MDTPALNRPAGGWLLAATIVVGLAGLGLLTETMQNAAGIGRWHSLIFLANGAGALALAGVLLFNLVTVLRQRRARVPGAALKLRLLGAFAAIAAAPLLVVFLVSVQFLHRGIESWVDDRIAAELGRSLALSRALLATERSAALARTRELGTRLGALGAPARERQLEAARVAAGATEISLFDNRGRLLATTRAPGLGQPELSGEEELRQLPAEGSAAVLEPVGDGGLRVSATIILGSASGEPAILQALYPVTGDVGALAASLQVIYTRYNESLFLSEPLESSFTLALAIVLLLALFTALYGALVFARRLVAPIRSLVAGTRAVAAGHMETRLPVLAHDDIGTLVESFNDMAERLGAAREEARRNAAQKERERARLATLLARLTSGVLAVDARGCLRVANEAADAILHAELRAAAGRSLEEIGREQPRLRGFLEACSARSQSSPEGWREQLVIPAESGGRRVLMCSAASLPEQANAGYVLVFEDITNLLQAQREAAWGEVARRLAHEIRNPLTPIQLSAERIRKRYLGTLSAAEGELLDRATHTIVQQVAALRDMVNAFGEYARAPELSFAALDLNGLVREVADLYHGPHQPQLALELDAGLGHIEADAVRLRQLLHNLIRNACEALEPVAGGRVVVATRHPGPGEAPLAEIRISDNGPGIDPEVLERIFDPYVTTKTRGTGLGLAIVRRLVEEHGGSIAAENLPGGGASITVKLPLRQAASEESRARRIG
jgi:nitrogen fixation/metabolism regulation signal transduction histidine kinase